MKSPCSLHNPEFCANSFSSSEVFASVNTVNTTVLHAKKKKVPWHSQGTPAKKPLLSWTLKKLLRISASMPLSGSTNVPLCFKYLLQSSKFKHPLLTYKQRLVFYLEICDRKQAAALTKRVPSFNCSPRLKRQPIMRQAASSLSATLVRKKWRDGGCVRKDGGDEWRRQTEKNL